MMDGMYCEAALWPDLTAVCVCVCGGQVLYGGRIWNSGVSAGGHEGECEHEQGINLFESVCVMGWCDKMVLLFPT